MLTPDDLHQIGQLLDQKLDTKLAPVKEDIKRLEAKIDAVSADMTNSFKDTAEMLGEIIAKLDELPALEQRVTRLERHVGLPPA